MLEAPACREGVVGLVSNTSPSWSIVGDDLGNLFGWERNIITPNFGACR